MLRLSSLMRPGADNPWQPAIVWALLSGLVAFILHSASLLNPDDSWLLYAAGRVLRGDAPYVDFYETNPPLILGLYLIPAFIANVLHVNAVPVFVLSVLLLGAASLSLALKELKAHPLLSQAGSGGFVFAALAQLLLACSLLLFGQREHLFLLLATPFFIQSSVLAQKPKPTGRTLLIALMAAGGIAIKPYFAVIWAAGELYSAFAARNPFLLFRASNWVIAAFGLLYVAAVHVCFPQYEREMLPMLLATYGAFTASGDGVLMPLIYLSLMYALPALLANKMPQHHALLGKLVCWFAAALLVVVAQDKGWINHYFPALYFGNFLLASLLGPQIALLKSKQLRLGYVSFAALWAMGFILFALPLVSLLPGRANDAFQRNYVDGLARYVTIVQAAAKPVYVLSFDLGAAFPAMASLPVRYPFHFHHLWALPAVVAAAHTVLTPQLEAAEKFTVSAVASDLETYKPALVVVDTNRFLAGPLKAFDFVAYFRHDAVFRSEWDHYREAGHLTVSGQDARRSDGQYTIYIREGE